MCNEDNEVNNISVSMTPLSQNKIIPSQCLKNIRTAETWKKEPTYKEKLKKRQNKIDWDPVELNL